METRCLYSFRDLFQWIAGCLWSQANTMDRPGPIKYKKNHWTGKKMPERRFELYHERNSNMNYILFAAEYPFLCNHCKTLSLLSPWTIIAFSLTDPPVPQKVFNFFSNASRSVFVPTKPSNKVTTLPARCLESKRIFIFCSAGSRVLGPGESSSCSLKSGSVE